MQIYWEKTSEELRASEQHEAAYALLYRVLREEWAVELADIQKTEAGKPYISGSSLKISISHTKGLVCCAVSEQGEIGVDCEYARKIPTRVSERVCTETELSDIQNADDPDGRFLRYWTLKESISKKLGVGMRESFKNYEIAWDGEEPVCAEHKLYSKQFEGFFIAAAE